MNLTEKNLSRKLSNYKDICHFMKRVFPKEELIPMWIIQLITLKKGYDFKVYYDSDLFVGIIFTIESDETIFVFYIAVNDQIHSKGYGSKLLQVLFNQYPNKPITLFIETMDDKNVSNYEQRVRRLAFYERNGFTHTGIKAGYKTPFVDILSTNKNYNLNDAKKLMKSIPMKVFCDSQNKG